MSTRRATLIDEDDRSRPSIPLRWTTNSSFMDTVPVKPYTTDDDSSDFRSQVRAVSLHNEQHSLRSRVSTTSTSVDKDSDGYLAESEDGCVDDTSGEVVSVDAIRDNDDESADITSIGESHIADMSVQTTGANDSKHLLLLHTSDDASDESESEQESESMAIIASVEALPFVAANGVSAFHTFKAELSTDGPDLEVQLKESQDEMQQATDRTSDDEIVADDDEEESEVDHPIPDGNRQPEPNAVRRKDSLSKRAWFLLAILFIILVAGIGAAIGSMTASSKSSAASIGPFSPSPSPVTSPNASPSDSSMCSFCYDGTVPQNLRNSTIRNSTSCLDFYNQLTGLFATDSLCPTGQALAWRYCACPSLPAAPVDPTCTLCPNGTATTNTSMYCRDLSTLVAIVGSSRLSNCNDLRLQVLPTCTCPNNVMRKAAFRALLSTVPGLNRRGNATAWQRAALNWIANEDFARIPPDRSRIKEITERYVAALLFFATGGKKWSSSANFLSESSVCSWNKGNVGLYCNNVNELEAIDLCKYRSSASSSLVIPVNLTSMVVQQRRTT